MSDLDATLNAYVAAWNANRAAARRRQLDRACAAQVAYTDPWGPLHGVALLAAHVERVRAAFPGSQWRLQGEVLHTVDRVLLRWIWIRDTPSRAEGHTLLRLDARQRILSATVRVHSTLPAWDPQPLHRLCKACGTTD